MRPGGPLTQGLEAKRGKLGCSPCAGPFHTQGGFLGALQIVPTFYATEDPETFCSLEPFILCLSYEGLTALCRTWEAPAEKRAKGIEPGQGPVHHSVRLTRS